MSGGGSSAGNGGFALPRAVRVTTTDEIRALLRRGKRRKTRHLDVFFSASPVARSSRIGLVVPKPRARSRPGVRRVRGAAVQRNRLKRRLREIARIELLPQLALCGRHVDVLVRARPEAYDATFQDLRQQLVEVGGWVCSSDG